jgi:hypothetical protein
VFSGATHGPIAHDQPRAENASAKRRASPTAGPAR